MTTPVPAPVAAQPGAGASDPQGTEHEAFVSALEHLVGLQALGGSDDKTEDKDKDKDGGKAQAQAHGHGHGLLAAHSSSHNALTPGPASREAVADAGSAAGSDTSASASASASTHRWWSRFFPSTSRIDSLLADEHMGNYVVVRSTGQVRFEAMPVYVRVGMHLLFLHSRKASLLRYESVDKLLGEVSAHQGRVYDDGSDPAAVLAHIRAFVDTYSIPLGELAQPRLEEYRTFNDFFSRRLREDARPTALPRDDHRIVASAADCRLTVFPSVDAATRIWIKGRHFSLAALLGDEQLAGGGGGSDGSGSGQGRGPAFPPGSSLAVFRLAPADYHRFHSPVGPATSGQTKHIPGQYFTVNPQAVNQDFDVFTSNRRDVLLSEWRLGGGAAPSGATPGAGAGATASASPPPPSVPYALVAIGALLVGSIGWTPPASTRGQTAARGDELGYFAYGGSTVVAVFPPCAGVVWDEDLRRESEAGRETIVRVGERIGRAGGGSG